MKKSTSKSIERSRKTFFTISKTLLKEGCSTIIPGGGLAFDAVATLAKHASQFYEDRTKERLHDFHQHLLGGGINESEIDDLLDKPISIEEYYSLLSATIQDDEDKKVQLYANLLRSLAKNLIAVEDRPFLIKAAKEMTFEEADFIRKYYIYHKYDIMPDTGPSVDASNMLKSNTIKHKIMIQNLIRRGFFFETSSNNIEPTQLMFVVVERLFSTDSIKPSAIGEITWSGVNIMIVSYQLDIYSSIASKIQKLLRNHRIKSTIGIIDERRIQTVNMFNNGIIFLLDNKEVSNPHKIAIKKLSPKKLIFKLLLKNSVGVAPEDTLPEIEADETLPIDINLKDDLSLFEGLIQKYTSKLA